MAIIRATYLDHAGSDLSVVNAARVSYGKRVEVLGPADIKLIHYLAKHQHYSPFEHTFLSVLVECPLYIRSQIHRHRTFSYNEVSRRYTSENIEFYWPRSSDIRAQSRTNKQGSDVPIDLGKACDALEMMETVGRSCDSVYNQLLEMGVAREQARAVLPQALMTQFWMSGNLRNWVHYLKLRLDDHAQAEGRKIAVDVEAIAEVHFPHSYAALMGEARGC